MKSGYIREWNPLAIICPETFFLIYFLIKSYFCKPDITVVNSSNISITIKVEHKLQHHDYEPVSLIRKVSTFRTFLILTNNQNSAKVTIGNAMGKVLTITHPQLVELSARNVSFRPKYVTYLRLRDSTLKLNCLVQFL